MPVGEIILGLSLVLILFGAGVLARPEIRTRSRLLCELMVWVARGFGVGRIPIAPGTFGSALGVLWFALLMAGGRPWVFILGLGFGIVLSIWFCGVAEAVLGQKDPGSVVLDEIAAMPVCFAAWVWLAARHAGGWPDLAVFFSGRNGLLSVGIFAAFRLFDIWKPWPARQSQSLPGGWGITVDDLLAAVYVNIGMLVVYAVKTILVGR